MLDQQQMFNLILALSGVIAALGFGGFAAAVMVVRQHKELVAMIYHSASPDTQKLIREVALGAKQIADLAVDVVTTPADTVTTTTSTPGGATVTTTQIPSDGAAG